MAIKLTAFRKRFLVAAIIGGLSAGFYGLYWDSRNPFDDVIFLVDLPGANGRHVTFTPTLRTAPTLPIGPVVGADYGRLRFADFDGDGIHEAIIETRPGLFGGLEFYVAERHVLKFDRSSAGVPSVACILSERL